MVRAWLRVGIICMALLGLAGCGSKGTPPVEVKPKDYTAEAKAILNDYAQGNSMGSEAMRFEEIIEEVKKTDPKKGAVLEKGFADLKKSPNKAAKAKELLKQL